MRVRTVLLLASLAFVCLPAPAQPQTTKPAVPAPKAPGKKPAAPAPAKKPDPAPSAVAKPVPAPPADVSFKSTYTTGDQVTESATYIRGSRERYELGDMILLRQHDEKRVIQISRGSNTYLVSPEGSLPTPAGAGGQAAGPKASGMVMMSTSIVDTGERKTAFGRQARRVKTMIDRQPQPGACDQSKLRIETDAWYIDLPKAMTTPAESARPSAAGSGCADTITTTENGDPNVLGFPIGYTTTFIEVDSKDNKPIVVTMEVTAFDVTRLDAALFEIPPGMTAAMNLQELSKAVSNANEVLLASGAPKPGVLREKKPGAIRVGVPDVANKTTQTVDTRAVRTRLIAELAEKDIDTVPMAAAPPAELDVRATEFAVDYLLMAEITDLKASKPGGVTRVMKRTSGEDASKDITEAKMRVQLMPAGALGGKPRMTTSTSGKDGGVGLRTGLGLAKFAGTLYLKMYLGGSPLGALNTMSVMNMGGMGVLGSPTLMDMQSGTGAMRMGMGADRTAGAANYMMQQAMMGSAASSGGPGEPSFDVALSNAIEDASKDVIEALKKPVTGKK